MMAERSELLHQNSGTEVGEGFNLLEEADNWTDDDVIYEFSIWGETVGYARVTREVEVPFHSGEPTTYRSDDLNSAIEEDIEVGSLFGDLYIERANNLDEAPIINNGDPRISQSGESYEVLIEDEMVGEAIMAGEGLEYELWQGEEDYTGRLRVQPPAGDQPGTISF